MRDDVDLDNRSLVVKMLSIGKDVALPYRIERKNGFLAKSTLVEGCLLNKRLEELKMLSKQMKE